MIGLCQKCSIITALPVGAITIFRIICIIQCRSLLVSSLALPISTWSSYVVIMTIIITTCHNVIHIILEWSRVCHQRHDYPCWYGVNARKGLCCWRFWGVGWGGGGVGRANNLHLHFHTNVMLMCVHTYVMLRYCAFLHFPTYIMLRYSTMDSFDFFCTFTHTSCCMHATSTNLAHFAVEKEKRQIFARRTWINKMALSLQ